MAPQNNPLADYFYQNRKNIIHKWPHYFDIYHQHFQRFVGKECVVLEIGVSQGGSLQMWKHYFGDKARIYGLDVVPECKQFEEEHIQIFIGSQSDRKFLKELKTKIPKIDILIDDGGHTMEQQIVTFEEMFDHISEDGIYLCEDTHTSYWEDYHGGYKNPGSFIEFAKTLVDKLNAWHSRNNELRPSKYTSDVNSLHFYDSIFVLEKKKRSQPWHEKRGLLINRIRNAEELKRENVFLLKMRLLGIDIPENLDISIIMNDLVSTKQLCGEKYEGTIWPEEAETMIGLKRLDNIEFCMNETISNKIEGDVIETGVWRGGACIFMRALLNLYGVTDKKVWVADSFEGLPKPNPSSYPDDEGDNLHTFKELVVSLEEVKSNFRKYNLLDEQVLFLKGWFKDSMPTAPIEKISVLRLDGDMYESTIDVFFYLYPKLSIGGYCIIDDWGAITACRKAVEDYRRFFSINERIQLIDWTGVFWKKETQVEFISRDRFNEFLKETV